MTILTCASLFVSITILSTLVVCAIIFIKDYMSTNETQEINYKDLT
jgi:hypothetical protein